MDVTVQATQGTAAAPDTFVSLRVGQVQRHARYAPCRKYRFDSLDSSKKHAVKLEVFKRIGHTTVTLGGITGDIQDVEVPCTDGTMCMQISNDQCAASAPPTEAKKTMKHLNSARNYLAQHNLEELLRDAMKDVMKAKPANPHEHLASYILRQGAGKRGLPPMPPIGEGWAKQQDPLEAFMTAKGISHWEDTDKGVLGHYVSRPLTPGGRPKKLPPLEARPLSGKSLSRSASVPNELTEKALAEQRRFMQSPSVGTWCVEKIPEKPETPRVPEYRDFKLRPSVGTWCAALPCEEPTDQTAYRKPQLRPSVGTWCHAKQTRPLHELMHQIGEPPAHETAAMKVILKGREEEIRDLQDKLREVNASLAFARNTSSAEVDELEIASLTLENFIMAAQGEYDALKQWSSRRGFSPPSSPMAAFRG